MSMRILITGADGFIGKNLRLRLSELGHSDIGCIGRHDSADAVASELARADVVFHLAGVNRPPDPSDFEAGNAGFTRELADRLGRTGRTIPVVFASSTQAELDNPYGRSKLAAERALVQYAEDTGSAAYIFRLPNVFGKWARPNYNSAVATFCHNLARGLPITVNDPAAKLRLMYVDDVVEQFAALLRAPATGAASYPMPECIYETTVGEVAELLQEFVRIKQSLVVPAVGEGLVRALYATYVSHLPVESFSYQVPGYSDPRGTFVEMLKTRDAGQFSYFTAHAGVTRGEHYHHTKTEKFLVIRGKARFQFRHVLTGERAEVVTEGGQGTIVETIPGWAHNITNIGTDELIVMLWANEIFDRARPDTYAEKVDA